MKYPSVLRASALAAVLAASGAAHAAPLVVNGSFEDPGVSSGTWNVFSSLPGWSSNNGIEVRNDVVGEAQDGQNFVELDGNRNSDMWQTITTVAGQLYELSFYYAPRIGVPAGSNGISVWWGNTLLTNPAITASGIGSTSNNWSLYTYTVLGTGSDVLNFAAVGTSDTLGGNIDNVAVSAVPLPGAALLFGSALFGAGALRRRNKQDQGSGSALAA